MADYYCQMHGVYGNGSQWSTGIHVTSSQSESALATTWGAALNDFWTNGTYGVQTLYPTATELTAYSVATLNVSLKEISKTLVPDVKPGTGTDDSLPYQESTLISLRSALIQRRGRGRMYLPAMVETAVNADVLISSAQTRVHSAVNALFAAIRADGSTVFVANKRVLTDGTVPFTKSVILTQLVSNKPARQSKRVRKVAAVYL